MSDGDAAIAPQLLRGLDTLTVKEVARVMQVQPETVRRWAREGRLSAMRWGGRLRFRFEAIREFQDGCRLEVLTPAENLRRCFEKRHRRR